MQSIQAWPNLYIIEWFSRNNLTEDKDQESTGMNINVNAMSTTVNIPVCTSIEDIQVATCKNSDL